MKIKKFGILGSALFGLIGIGCLASVSVPIAVKAEELEPTTETTEIVETTENTESVEPVEPTFTATVAIVEPQNGTISADITSGNVGDTVALTVKANTFYVITTVVVDDTTIAASEDGLYRFVLVEGENIVSATFTLDEKIVGEFASLWEEIKAGDWKNVFTVENVLLIINYLINSGIGVALVSLFSKYKKGKTIDRKEVISTIQNAVPEQADKIIQDLVNEKLLPTLTPVIAKVDDITEAMKIFVQAFLYSLDDTMEAKEKIISLLSGIKLTDSSTVEEVKKVLDEYIAKVNAKYEENMKLLEEMKKSSQISINGTVESDKTTSSVAETISKVDDGTQI